jgi:DNA replication and repair protein RecF
MEDFLVRFQHYYALLAQGNEQVGIDYESPMTEGPMEELLRAAVTRDRSATHTTVGIHKDDLVFRIGEHALKRFGSQGQQKSMLVALKLAQYALMRAHTGMRPMLLLDDIFDKLDEARVGQLLDIVSGPDFGQILITDTHPERTAQLLKGESNVRVFRVLDGSVSRI